MGTPFGTQLVSKKMQREKCKGKMQRGHSLFQKNAKGTFPIPNQKAGPRRFHTGASDTALWTLLDHGIDIYSLLPELNEARLPIRVRRHLASYEAWFIASDRRLPLVEPPWIDFGACKSFADLDNPFEPLVEIWLKGYRLVSRFTEKDPYIRLYGKPLDPGERNPKSSGVDAI